MKMNVTLLVAISFIFGAASSFAEDGRNVVLKVVKPTLTSGSFAKSDLRRLNVISAPEVSEENIVNETFAAEKDYMPLKENRTLIYSYESSENEHAQRIEVKYVNVKKVNADYTSADIEVKVIPARKKASKFTFSISKGKKLVKGFNFVGGNTRTEFVLPLEKGATWKGSNGEDLVASLLGRVNVPAGSFTACLKITTKIHGGDGGSATRYYANNIGLVYEEINAEDSHSVLKLIEVKE